jgi:hypothetical protein
VKQGSKVAIEREVGGDQRKSLEVQEMEPHGVVTVVMREGGRKEGDEEERPLQ